MISRRTAICLAVIGFHAASWQRFGGGLSDPAGEMGRRIFSGGATDIIARLIGQRLSERLGQQF